MDDDRRFDDYTTRLRFSAAPVYYVQSQYHISDAAGSDCRRFSDASCDSSRSPGYRACSCRSTVDAETPKTPADTGVLPRHFEPNSHHHHHQEHDQQPPQPASFAIHQLLGLGADIRSLDVSYDRQLALDTIDIRCQSHVTPPAACRCDDCVQSFNPDVDAPLSSPSCLAARGSHQLNLPYCSRPTSASIDQYYRQHHGSTTTRWPYLREPLQIPPPLTPWSNGEPHVPKKTIHHRHHYHLQQPQQEPQRHYDKLQAYCAARLQPRNVDVTSYDSVIRQCHVSYLPPNLGMYYCTESHRL